MTAIGPGSTLGPYQVLSALGSGGMGVVYRARDTRLHRDVALKCLRPEIAGDPDRLARFHREAEMLASLNHPNIGAIHGVEESGATVALVLELVDGPTLSDILVTRALPVDRVLRIAAQIAEAVDAAHRRGIIHRDLKPSNIKLADHDAVKVLDFGLAKASSDDPAILDVDARTILTSTPGMIVGTTNYISPEQARGEPATYASDIWAFGCVLFEMLSATRAFDGATPADTLGRVMAAEPDWARIPADTPPAIRTLIERCLRKEPRARLQHIGDARVEIEDAMRQPRAELPGKRVAPTWRRIERVAWLTALVLVGSIAVAALTGVFGGRTVPPRMRLDMAAPPTTSPASMAVSPDGLQVVFAGMFNGISQLWMRSLETATSRQLAGTGGAQYPFWSPDGGAIGFFADGKIKRIDVTSGVVQPLANVSVATGGTWNRDGVILFSGSTVGPILRVPSTGGEPVAVTMVKTSETFHSFPQFLPDGLHFLYHVTGAPAARGIYIGRLDGGEAKRLLERDAPALFAHTRHLIFVDQGTLYAQPFDPDRLAVAGDPVPVAEQVMIDPIGLVPAVSVSTAGSILYRTGTSAGQRQFIWFDRAGREIGRLGNPDSATAQNPSQSPDGSVVALNRTVDGNSDVWFLDTTRGLLTRFTNTDTIDVNPVWSPDGRSIAFGSNRRGVFDLYAKRVASADPGEVLVSGDGSKAPTDWSPDGGTLLYRVLDAKTGWDLLAVSLVGARTPFPVVQTDFDETNGQFSADGRWIAYQSSESGGTEIYLQSFPDPGTKVRVSAAGGTQPRWRRDGRELFYVALDGRMMAVPITMAPGRPPLAGSPVALFPTTIGSMGQNAQRQQYMVSADGQRFLVNTVPEANTPITILLNW